MTPLIGRLPAMWPQWSLPVGIQWPPDRTAPVLNLVGKNIRTSVKYLVKHTSTWANSRRHEVTLPRTVRAFKDGSIDWWGNHWRFHDCRIWNADIHQLNLVYSFPRGRWVSQGSQKPNKTHGWRYWGCCCWADPDLTAWWRQAWR